MVFANRSPFFSYGEQHTIGKSQRSIQYIYIYIYIYTPKSHFSVAFLIYQTSKKLQF